MDETEQRQIARDSLFMMADLRLDEGGENHRIKVRNLSAGGMMGEGAVRVSRGAQVWIEIRNLGWVEGSIAWIQDSRFGVAFHDEIDPKIARATGSGEVQVPRHVEEAFRDIASRAGSTNGVLRKV